MRTWSMYRWLNAQADTLNMEVDLLLLHDGSHTEGLNVYCIEDMKQLYRSVLNADAIVTTGLFYH